MSLFVVREFVVLRLLYEAKNTGTKSINVSDIMIYVAMFNTTNDKIAKLIPSSSSAEMSEALILFSPDPPPLL